MPGALQSRESATTDKHDASYFSRKRRLCLEVLRGDDAGKTFRLRQGQTILGRKTGFTDLKISREHAQLIVDNEDVWIEDLESSNGTYVGVDKVVGRRALHIGETFSLGVETLILLAILVEARS